MLLLVMLLLLALPFGALAENLLVNGGFDALDSDGLPSGWYPDAYDQREGISTFGTTAEARTGGIAAVVENFGENDARFAQRVKVEPDSLYLLSGWIRADAIEDSGRGANISVSDLYDACSSSVFDSRGEWVHVEMYGRTGPEQTEVTVFARVGGYSGVSVGRASFDDLSLVKVDALPAGVSAKDWFKVDSPVYINSGSDAAEEETPDGFWPWLLGICGVYIALGLWAMRWMQSDSQTDPRLCRAFEKKNAGKADVLFLLAGLAVATVIRFAVGLQVEGYGVDVGCFRAWGYSILTNGPQNFYGIGGDFALHNETGANFCDYPPGYLYILGFGEMFARLTGLPQYFCHKLVPMYCDILAAVLIYRIARTHGCHRRQGTLMALLFAFNPATILNSAAWCQVDSVLCFTMMLVAYLAMSRRWAVALPVYVLGVLIKPQALMLGFLGMAAMVMELVRSRPRREKAPGGGKSRLVFPKVWKQMGIGALVSVALGLIIVIPFSAHQSSPFWLFSLYGETLSSYPYATVNTANLYYLSDGNWDSVLQNADLGVKVFFTLMSAAWAVYTLLRRTDREKSWREPVLAVMLAAGVAMLALGGLGIAGGTGDYLLTTGNPWIVFIDESGSYVRQHMPMEGRGTTLALSPALLLALGAVLVAAAASLCVLLARRIRSGRQERMYTGLIEPALMALFALVFGGMCFFDVTWGALGTVSMAMAFAIVLPMFIRGRDLKHLPLCGAVLFVLLFVFGVKMHERYLFPALFLLGMAYAVHRDRRILWLLIGLSCTMLLNEGIILDNDLRMGSSYGHINTDPDSVWLTYVTAFVNVLLGLWSVWVCRHICVEGAPVRLTQSHDMPLFPVRQHAEKPCTPLNYRTPERVKWTRLDALLIAVVTLLYGIVTLTTLGSTRAPQNPWKSTSAREQVIIDLGEVYEDFSMLYFAQVSYNDFTVATSDDGEVWPDERVCWAQMAEGQCFRWKYLLPCLTGTSGSRTYVSASDYEDVQKLDGRYVCITAQQVGLVLNEVIFRDAEGNRIPATVVGALNANENSPLYSAPENLLDEQDTLEGEPGWWNSTYFDEIYHARTGYEHLMGTAPYETSHPPLGKVIMSWCIGLFGMTPFGWRFAGAMCGILMLPAMYLLAKQLTRRTDMGFAAMMLMALDCMHFTQTRIATIDSFPVLFIILSYFFMLRFMQRDIIRDKVSSLLPDLALSGFFMACGVASKWIGVYAGVGLAVLYFWHCLRQLRIGIDCARLGRSGKVFTKEEQETLNLRDHPALKRVFVLCLWCLLFFVAVTVAIYLLSYIPYFANRKLSFFEYLREVIKAQEGMLSYHSTPGLGMDHPFYSPWYEWPLNQRPMYYASDAFTPEGWGYAIFCFGNPAVWYVGLAGIAYTFVRWLRHHRYRVDGMNGTWHLYADTWEIAPAFVLVGLLAQFLPWVLVPRGTYIYHYFASVPFLILGTVLLLSRLCREGSRSGRAILAVYLGVTLVLFVLLFPYASGLLTPVEWLNFVRDYPWVNVYQDPSALKQMLVDVMNAVPLFPHLYH